MHPTPSDWICDIGDLEYFQKQYQSDYKVDSPMITFKTNYPQWFNIIEQKVYGGIEYQFNAGYELADIMGGMRDLLAREALDAKVRSEQPFVRELYDQYKTALELARQDQGKGHQ